MHPRAGLEHVREHLRTGDPMKVRAVAKPMVTFQLAESSGTGNDRNGGILARKSAQALDAAGGAMLQ